MNDGPSLFLLKFCALHNFHAEFAFHGDANWEYGLIFEPIQPLSKLARLLHV
jgi:hypothetical protein